jgi:hypothetical protein
MISTLRLLAVLATAGLAFPALAQPGADDTSPTSADNAAVQPGTVVLVPGPPPPPGTPVQVATIAPQNENWNNVSHINGQVVKVGERGDYLHRWKTTNIATNPIGWMFGFYGLSVSRAVHDNAALRGDINAFSFDEIGGYEIGLSVPIYFRRVFSGPFLEPGVITRQFSDTCDGCTSNDEPSVGPEMLFGWHWTFDSGLNVAMAGGAMRDLNRDGRIEPAGYFRIGYAM